MRMGIDFGTVNTSAALVSQGSLVSIKENRQNTYSFPSSVFATPEGIAVCHSAEMKHFNDHTCYKNEIKHELGRPERIVLGNQEFQVEYLIAQILKKLKVEAETAVGTSITGVVLTIPATYEAHRKLLMRQAGFLAGFSEVDLLREPEAASLYYTRKQILGADGIFLSFDLGGGTFDASLVKKQGNQFSYPAKPVGMESCGGVEFDKKIRDDLISQSGELRQLLSNTRNER